jgi:hypothetical protein
MSTSGAAWAPLGDLDEFGCRHWDRAPLHRRGDDAFDASAVLDLDALDRLITSRHTHHRLLDRGTFLDDERHREVDAAGGGRGWRSDPAAVLAAFRQGRTIVVPDVHELWPPIDVLASRLAGQLRATVTASLFVSSGESLTDWHADDSHGVVLQLHGAKRWLVERDGPAGTPQTSHPLDLRLRPGDVLYLPQGFMHHVRGVGNLSVHVTFSCSTPTWAELGMAALAGRFAGGSDVQLHRSVVDPGWGPRSQARWMSEVRQLVDALTETVGALEEKDIAAARSAAPGRPVTHDRAFLRTCAALSVSAQSAVRVRPGLEVTMQTGPDVLTLRFDDRCLELPHWLLPGVTSLLGSPNHALTPADLPLEPADATVLVRRLVAEGMLDVCAATEGGRR